MRTSPAPYLGLTWTLLVGLVLGAQALVAQTAPGGAGQNAPVKLTGSTKEIKDVARDIADFVGQITNLDPPVAVTAGMYRSSATVKVSQVLLPLDQSLARFAGVSLNPYTSIRVDIDYNHKIHEEAPKSGTTYIFITGLWQINSMPARFSADKLLPATDDNIAEVKKLIAAAPAAK